MTERIPAPADIANTNWNSDGTTYPSVDPGGAKRATGFKPINVPPGSGDGEIITANDQNYLHGLAMQLHNWVKQFIPREWEELSEGIANATATRQLLRVVPPSGGIRSRGVQLYSTPSVATGVGLPRDIVTDGLRTFYFGGTGDRYIVAVSPVDGQDGAGGGVPLWEINPHGVATVMGIGCDGAYLFYSMSATVTGLQRVDADTGGNLASAGTKVGHFQIRSNGINAVGIKTGGVVDSWDIAPMTDNWTNTPTTALWGIAIDEDNTYVGGVRNTNDIWAYTNASGSSAWSVQLDPTSRQVAGIAADGDFVYVVTDRVALSAGGFGCLFCLERTTGAVLWVKDLGVDITHVAVDDEYIFALDNSADNLYIIRKGQVGPALGSPGIVKVVSNMGAYATTTISVDGTSVWTHDAATPANIKRISTGGPSKTFMRVVGGDPRRRPTHTLAIPTTGRV
jgi:hypothetical protein